jgi:predicted membrane chloride channel (bestrophin family)
LNDYDYTTATNHRTIAKGSDPHQALTNLSLAVWALPRSLQSRLLTSNEDEHAFVRDVQNKLDPTMAAALISARHRPTRALFYLSQAVDALPLVVEEKIAIDNSVVVLTDMMGTCERLFSSPVPLVYTR